MTPLVQILSFQRKSQIGRDSLPEESNRKSRKLFPFVKMAKNYGNDNSIFLLFLINKHMWKISHEFLSILSVVFSH